MSYGVTRVPLFMERLFPSLIWGHPNRCDGPIYLTFDDGPDPQVTPRLLDCLKRHEVPATFFLLGNKLQVYHKTTSLILEYGHKLGYHGRTHETWWFRSGRRRLREMDPFRIQKRFSEWFQNEKLLLRPPHGRFDPLVLKSARGLGATVVQFRLVIGDWLPGKTKSMLIHDLLLQARPGDIIALHDGSRNGHLLPHVLDHVIPRWRDRGYTFGRIIDLLKEPGV